MHNMPRSIILRQQGAAAGVPPQTPAERRAFSPRLIGAFPRLSSAPAAAIYAVAAPINTAPAEAYRRTGGSCSVAAGVLRACRRARAPTTAGVAAILTILPEHRSLRCASMVEGCTRVKRACHRGRAAAWRTGASTSDAHKRAVAR